MKYYMHRKTCWAYFASTPSKRKEMLEVENVEEIDLPAEGDIRTGFEWRRLDNYYKAGEPFLIIFYQETDRVTVNKEGDGYEPGIKGIYCIGSDDARRNMHEFNGIAYWSIKDLKRIV